MNIFNLIVGSVLILSIFAFVWHYELKESMTTISLQACKCCQTQLQRQELGLTNGFTTVDINKGYHIWLYLEIISGILGFIIIIKNSF